MCGCREAGGREGAAACFRRTCVGAAPPLADVSRTLTHTNTHSFLSPSTQHDKPKPWDHDGIDHWTVHPFTRDDNPHGLLEESSFAVLFPKYRERYLRDAWPVVTKALKEVGIGCELNLVEVQ